MADHMAAASRASRRTSFSAHRLLCMFIYGFSALSNQRCARASGLPLIRIKASDTYSLEEVRTKVVGMTLPAETPKAEEAVNSVSKVPGRQSKSTLRRL